MAALKGVLYAPSLDDPTDEDTIHISLRTKCPLG